MTQRLVDRRAGPQRHPAGHLARSLRLRQRRRARDQVAESVGHAGLGGELRSFANNWEIKRKRMSSSLNALEVQLRAISNTFEKQDREFERHLQPNQGHGQSVPGGGSNHAAPRGDSGHARSGGLGDPGERSQGAAPMADSEPSPSRTTLLMTRRASSTRTVSRTPRAQWTQWTQCRMSRGHRAARGTRLWWARSRWRARTTPRTSPTAESTKVTCRGTSSWVRVSPGSLRLAGSGCPGRDRRSRGGRRPRRCRHGHQRASGDGSRDRRRSRHGREWRADCDATPSGPRRR